MEENKGYLTGKFLIAMPTMPDPRFSKAVVLICGHDENGAMGLIINKPLTSLSFADLLENLRIETSTDQSGVKLHFGGPVEVGRGFVVHSPDYHHESSVEVTKDLTLTASADILRAIVTGEGPKQHMLALGYAGWGAGQLDKEILENGWVVSDAAADIIFDEDLEDKWLKSLAQVGIKPEMLSMESGHA